MDNLDNLIIDIVKKYQNLNPQTKSINHSDNQVNNSANNHDIDSFLSNLQGKKESQQSSDLLTEIQVKFQNKKTRSNSKESSSQDLLTEIESKFEQQQSKKNQKKVNSSNLLTDIEKEFQQKKSSSNINQKSTIAEQNLDNIAQTYAKKQAEIKQQNKTENLEEIRRKELEKQRQEKQLIRQAEQWLKNLDPYSDEGFWFEQFALSYASKLEAAIDYLRALQ